MKGDATSNQGKMRDNRTLVIIRGDARIDMVTLVETGVRDIAREQRLRLGSSATKNDWIRVLEGPEAFLKKEVEGSVGEPERESRVVPWPNGGNRGCLQNLLAAISQLNEDYFEEEKEKGVTDGDVPRNISLSIACSSRAQFNDLVCWIGKRTIKSTAGIALTNLEFARKVTAHVLSSFQDILRVALAEESTVEDSILQRKMESMVDIIALDGTTKNRVSLCLGAGAIATRLLQLLKGEETVLSPEDDTSSAKDHPQDEESQLMVVDDVNAMVEGGFLAEEFSHCFKRLLQVCQAYDMKMVEGEIIVPSIAELICVFGTMMEILEVVLTIEDLEGKYGECPVKKIVLPDGIPKSCQEGSGPLVEGRSIPACKANVGVREGDWICPECGDFQFARNFRCRQCNAPKPGTSAASAASSFGGSGMSDSGGKLGVQQKNSSALVSDYHQGFNQSWDNGNGAKHGDWECPNCGDYQFGRNAQCRRCGQAKPSQAGGGYGSDQSVAGYSRRDHSGRSPHDSHDLKPGDWVCKKCNDLQFARNQYCRRCGADKATATGSSSHTQREDDHFSSFRNTSRKDDHHSFNSFRGGGGNSRGDDQFSSFRSKYSSTQGGYGGSGSGGYGSNRSMNRSQGDWACPQCGDNVFGRNFACRRCGCPRPSSAQEGLGSGGAGDMFGSAGGSLSSSYSSGGAMPRGGGGGGFRGPNFKPGDWECPNCGDHVFARNHNCRRCGAAKVF